MPGPEQFGLRAGLGTLDAIFVLVTLIHSRIFDGKRLYVAFVDLRTAFPSLNRDILIRRMFECGVGLAMYRLALAALEVSVSIVKIGNWLGKPFAEKRGVREGAVESPLQFSMYVDGLRRRLEHEHPHLCRMMHIVVA
eukprot:2647441-Karenia_brevis.AAC.1